jgi:SAM-dependent methyltransferase
MRYGWDHPETVRYYELFSEHHIRYRHANEALVTSAELAPGQRILDIGAGTGRTAELALRALEGHGAVVCVEPATAMRAEGRTRLPHLHWLCELPERDSFDRVLCGAAVWQLAPLEATFVSVFDLLKDGGAFCFNIPSLYLGEPDEPGGGQDPMLQELVARLAKGRAPNASATAPPPDAHAIEGMLRGIGFRPRRWRMRMELTQTALRDWLRIPVLTDALLEDFSSAQRCAQIDEAFAGCDPASWKWEAWTGWTAWK